VVSEERPALSSALSGRELERWYWLKAELVDFARVEGLATSGSKAELMRRLGGYLDGEALPPTATKPRRSGARLPEPLTPETRLPLGQSSSQQLRQYLTEVIGPAFRFDAAMRAFIAEAEPTLADVVEHWHATRSAPKAPPTAQFEYNRFTIAWHAAHPDRTAAECREAWALHRSLPKDQRPTIT